MPVPALPIPLGEQPQRKPFRRVYNDPLGEPMTGRVAVTSLRRLNDSSVVTPEASTSVVELVEGVLEVFLQPGFYKLAATLTSPSGHAVSDVDTVTVTG